MEIPTRRNRFRQHHPTRVHGLPHAKLVAATGDFLDEDWGEVLSAEFFVDAEKVYFDCFDGFVADAEGDGDAGDESAETAAFGVGRAETDVPGGFVVGGQEGPGVNKIEGALCTI
jgi:hypothetical protein